MTAKDTIAALVGLFACLFISCWVGSHPGELDTDPARSGLAQLKPVEVQSSYLPQLTADESSLWDKFAARAEQAADRRIERREDRIAKELNAVSTDDIVAMLSGKMSADRMRFMSLIVGAIIALVLAALKAAIGMLVMTLIWKYILAHKFYVIAAYVCGVILPAALTARLFSK